MEDQPEFTKERAEKSQAIELLLKPHFEHNGFLDRENRTALLMALVSTDAIRAVAAKLDKMKSDSDKSQAVMLAITNASDAMGAKGHQIYEDLIARKRP